MCEQYGIIPIMMNYLDEDIIYKDTMEKSDIIAFYKQKLVEIGVMRNLKNSYKTSMTKCMKKKTIVA